ncbi:hypothetical protein G6Y41_04620 [Staphylococcus aureus]|nr:hypothetical protein [Staphylococcus aureus]
MQNIKSDHQNIIKRSEKDKLQAYFLGLLIMIVGLLINANIYVKIRGNKELKNLICTATHNDLDLEHLMNMNQDDLKKIEWIKLSKSEYALDYVRLVMCVYTCVALCLPSVMLTFFT